MTACEQKIRPSFNSMVIFKTDDFSYHGHPDPLTCPENITENQSHFIIILTADLRGKEFKTYFS